MALLLRSASEAQLLRQILWRSKFLHLLLSALKKDANAISPHTLRIRPMVSLNRIFYAYSTGSFTFLMRACLKSFNPFIAVVKPLLPWSRSTHFY
ncbi:MAG: hypothetical protein CMQ45_04100 [Gammaproteobacteria bacterium]|nr:hypothetical protein [Gammaproteobacteria bacterium]